MSLYPSVNALDKYPIAFKEFHTPTVQEITSGEFFGIVKCTVTPPNNLYVPVLPENKDNKLIFDLKKKQGTWTSIEVKKAIEMGYVIDEIHAGFKYKQFIGSMKRYVEFFLKIETANNKQLTIEECDELNTKHKELGLDITIKPDETAKNPGMKMIAKICLNSLWGKFGQRPDLNNYDFFLKKMNTIN